MGAKYFIKKVGRGLKSEASQFTNAAGKGVGEGEALLALLGREGRKMDVGDVQIQGKELEIKGRDGRLIGRGEDL